MPMQFSDLSRRAKPVLAWAIFIAVIVAATIYGVRLRRWTFVVTDSIHFIPDITRGYGWGRAANSPEGFLNLYEKMQHEQGDWPLWLDYAPLRLAVMDGWAKINLRTQPHADQWQPNLAFNAPVLWFNTAMEWIGAAAAFFIVRRVVRWKALAPPALSWPREWLDRLRRRPPVPLPLAAPLPCFVGCRAGLIAALLLWFNPCMILSSHGWPTWDMWIVPMYLVTLLATLYDAWFIAGGLFAIGMMLKAQQMAVLPLFIVWPLLIGRPMDTLRFACGFLIVFIAIASPWLVTYIPAEKLAQLYDEQSRRYNSYDFAPFIADRFWNWPLIIWAIASASVVGCAPILVRHRRSRWTWAAAVVGVLLIVWPGLHPFDLRSLAILFATAAVLIVGVAIATRRSTQAMLVLTTAALALAAGVSFFGASTAWWDCGMTFGTRHWPGMTMGPADNLAGLLDQRFDWQIEDTVTTLPLPAWAGGDTVVNVRTTLESLFVITLILCIVATARHARRRDPRWLIAVTAPWLMFFCFLPQMHERYLLYAAATGSILIGQSIGMALLAVFLTGLAWVQTMHAMMNVAGDGRTTALARLLHNWQPTWFTMHANVSLHRFTERTHPDAAWAVLLSGAIFLYAALRGSRRAEWQGVKVDEPPVSATALPAVPADS